MTYVHLVLFILNALATFFCINASFKATAGRSLLMALACANAFFGGVQLHLFIKAISA